jgi:outer membrane cobalamin receptor
MRTRLWFVCLLALFACRVEAQVFGTVRVVARDQQNLAIPGADVTIKASGSAWTQSVKTSGEGEAVFPAVPVGQYIVSVIAPGFDAAERNVTVASNAVTPVAVPLKVAGLAQSVVVAAEAQTINPESSRTETLVQRADILHDPDADRSGSLAMITNNVPGAFVMHDHLHSRGGHGVSWQIDGVPVPNSNLASVGSQFDPKDVDSLEINRGGLSANYGDRSYGVFNVVPRSGFEGHRFADAAASAGNFHQAHGYLSLGDHTGDDRFSYFASVSANRTDRGLERVDIPVLHDDAAGVSGFTSMIVVPRPTDQFRFVGLARTDRYQVPNIAAQEALGISDREVANDALVNVTWARTSDAGWLITASPYYHFNRGEYIGGAGDPLVTNDDRGSHYAGGFVNVSLTKGRHTVHLGSDSFAEHYDSSFALRANDGSGLTLREDQRLWATVVSLFADDTFRATPWLTLNTGLRFERFSGTLTEHATTPRLGAAVTVPHVGVLRGSYNRYYQHPQVATIEGPVLGFALQEGFGFLPLQGERDEIWEVGLGIPIHGWTLDVDAFHNSTHNLVDHEVLGNSNLLFPLTIDSGRVRAFESTLKSPSLWHGVRLHAATSIESAQGRGEITGGLTDFQPPSSDYFYLDHDQRVTLSAGAQIVLARGLWASMTVLYGSGFLRGNGPDHMPRHTTADLAIGKDIGEKVALRLTVLNVADSLYLTGIDNSFAGTHYANPRDIAVQLRYKFHY